MSPSPRPLPQWLQLVCTVVVVGHLALIGLYALAVRSGPWPYNIGTNSGISEAEGPAFATSISSRLTLPYYLTPLRMTHNYHFASDRHTDFAVYFEVRLKDEAGLERTLKFPDEKASFWVRHRQEILAQNLAHDHPLPPRTNEKVAPEGKQLPMVEIWVQEEPQKLVLKKFKENSDELRNPQAMQPSPSVKAMVASYLRFLCKEHNAASAELIRCHRLTVVPTDLFGTRPPDVFKELRSHFGVYRREQ